MKKYQHFFENKLWECSVCIFTYIKFILYQNIQILNFHPFFVPTLLQNKMSIKELLQKYPNDRSWESMDRDMLKIINTTQPMFLDSGVIWTLVRDLDATFFGSGLSSKNAFQVRNYIQQLQPKSVVYWKTHPLFKTSYMIVVMHITYNQYCKIGQFMHTQPSKQIDENSTKNVTRIVTAIFD